MLFGIALVSVILVEVNGSLDANGCLFDWIYWNDNCYHAFKDRKTFDSSEAICVRYGGHLTSMKGSPEHTFIKDKVTPGVPDNNFWIGLVKNNESMLEWIDGTPFLWTVPDGDLFFSRCVLLSNGYWLPTVCEREHYYICKIPPVKYSTTLKTAPPTTTTSTTTTTTTTPTITTITTTPSPTTTTPTTTTLTTTTPTTTTIPTTTPTTAPTTSIPTTTTTPTITTTTTTTTPTTTTSTTTPTTTTIPTTSPTTTPTSTLIPTTTTTPTTTTSTTTPTTTTPTTTTTTSTTTTSTTPAPTTTFSTTSSAPTTTRSSTVTTIPTSTMKTSTENVTQPTTTVSYKHLIVTPPENPERSIVDNRPSAVGIGLLGVGILIAILVVAAISDIPTFYKHIKWMIENIRSRWENDGNDEESNAPLPDNIKELHERVFKVRQMEEI